MNVQEIFLAIISVISSLLIVFLVVFIGWYLVWKIFLSRFRLVRELLGQMNGDPSENNKELKAGKSKKIRRE